VSAIILSTVSFINQTLINKQGSHINTMHDVHITIIPRRITTIPRIPTKWTVIQAITTNNLAPLATIMVVTSLITLYYYLKISSRFMNLNMQPKWKIQFHTNKTIKNIRALILLSTSLTRITVWTPITNIN
jgi:hypothetical protein